MRKKAKHRTIGFMIVVMMTILALLPHISSAMEQSFFDELNEVEEIEEIQYKAVVDQESMEVDAGAGNDRKDKVVGQEESVSEFLNTRHEVLPLGIEGGMKEVEVVSLFCIVTACTGLAVMMTTKKKKKVYSDINYW